MTVVIIIFLIAIISLFGMLIYRAWEIKTLQVETPVTTGGLFPEIHFRHVEKFMLYLAKHVIQWIVLVVVRYWFIVSTKTKKWIGKKSPKIHNFFSKKKELSDPFQKPSFVQRAVLESKMKIKHIREKVRREHEEVIDTNPKKEEQI
jgi:hypothetical protein